jgi:hypothetical protein
MSVPTAKTHVSRILAKLGARDRAQLVVMAYQSGLVRALSGSERSAGLSYNLRCTPARPDNATAGLRLHPAAG